MCLRIQAREAKEIGKLWEGELLQVELDPNTDHHSSDGEYVELANLLAVVTGGFYVENNFMFV